ncbi:MAG TPA: ABC transporter permease [Candidatus Thermoplasmatota archaeon]|nr:ABC transporter permease [Candidatus Thermoplasmatota archaeon]
MNLGATWRGIARPWSENAGTQSKILFVSGLAITLLFILVAIFAPLLATADPEKISADRREPPSLAHPFGTSRLGFDIWSQAVFGARIALEVVLVSTVFAVLLAVPLGLFSGYVGGRWDRALVLTMDSVYAFPGLLVAIIISSIVRPQRFFEPLGLEDLAPVLAVAMSISVVYIPQYFRVIRNHVVAVKEEPYVEAARAIGAKPRTIVGRYVFFNVVQSVPIILTLNAADAILTLAALGFLGYGLPPPTPEWGYNLSRAASEIGLSPPIWWTSVFPGLMIVLLVLGVTLLGEAINDIWNPLLKEKGR